MLSHTRRLAADFIKASDGCNALAAELTYTGLERRSRIRLLVSREVTRSDAKALECDLFLRATSRAFAGWNT